MNKQELFDKFIEFMGRFAEIRAVAALRDGFIMTTPFTICGSVFLLLANLPIPGYGAFMAGLFGPDWTAPLNAVSGATFSILAFISVLAITYKYVEAEGGDAIMASILALSTFLIVLPPTIVSKGGETVADVIPKAWAGSTTAGTHHHLFLHRTRLYEPVQRSPGSMDNAADYRRSSAEWLAGRCRPDCHHRDVHCGLLPVRPGPRPCHAQRRAGIRC